LHPKLYTTGNGLGIDADDQVAAVIAGYRPDLHATWTAAIGSAVVADSAQPLRADTATAESDASDLLAL
jgi:hypothetical protein